VILLQAFSSIGCEIYFQYLRAVACFFGALGSSHQIEYPPAGSISNTAVVDMF